MNKKAIVLLLIFVILTLTKCQIIVSKQLRIDKLPSTFYTISVNADTILHTLKGGMIKIQKGTLLAGNAASVTLEVKEAYTMEDMVLAGLTTTSGKQLLSSGGMILVNPINAKDVRIAKPISISIPTDRQQDGMQLFKGEEKTDGSINWKDPQPLPKQSLSSHLEEGKILYQQNCTSCHKLLTDATGPALATVNLRRRKEWLDSFVHNSALMIANHESLAICVYNEYSNTIMTAYPDLSSDNIEAILDYANSVYNNKKPGAIADYIKSYDSCIAYFKAKNILELKRVAFIKGNGLEININRNIPISNAISKRDTADSVVTIPSSDVKLVQPLYKYAESYQFDIETFGWYNVDIFTKNIPGFAESELTVAITGMERNDLNLYLILPEAKIFAPGGLIKDYDNLYGFYEDNGKIPLPQNASAYILVIGQQHDKIYFGKLRFTTSLNQSLTVASVIVTPEQLNQEIKNLGLSDLEINAKKSKNADSIQNLNIKLSDLEKMKPVNCACGCSPLTQLLKHTDTGIVE